MRIEMVTYETVAPFKAAAAKERSIISNGERTYWFAAFDNGKIVGVNGANVSMTNLGRIKGTYVVPEHRGKGISKKLNQTVFDFLCYECLVSKINAFVTTDRNLAWYTKKGFKVKREKNGIAYVERNT